MRGNLNSRGRWFCLRRRASVWAVQFVFMGCYCAWAFLLLVFLPPGERDTLCLWWLGAPRRPFTSARVCPFDCVEEGLSCSWTAWFSLWQDEQVAFSASCGLLTHWEGGGGYRQLGEIGPVFSSLNTDFFFESEFLCCDVLCLPSECSAVDIQWCCCAWPLGSSWGCWVDIVHFFHSGCCIRVRRRCRLCRGCGRVDLYGTPNGYLTRGCDQWRLVGYSTGGA